MAEIIISPILQVLFEKLASKAENVASQYLRNKKRAKELPETIRRWKKKLGQMEAVMRNAEQQQFKNEAVQNWLHELRDWAYDLEDIFDDFATDLRLKYFDSQPRDEHEDHSPPTCSCSPFNKVPSFVTWISEVSDSNNDSFLTKIEKISARLEAIESQVGMLNMIRQQSYKVTGMTTSMSTYNVLGRDYDRRQIIDRLLTYEPNHGNYVVIAIVGQGGIGKTTLAQSVYNDYYVKPRFDIKAWVCVSEVFDVHQIMTTIISAVVGQNLSKFTDLNEAQEKLRAILIRKRFLIVLDDVWSDKYELWDQLQAPFQSGEKGSRVLVTTRWLRVAETMRTTPTTQSHVVKLKGLSDDECWNICKQHALIDDYDNPIETRTQVVELSKGLPLAAKALGGLLKQTDRRDWLTTLRNNVWSKNDEVLSALRLSYYQLPHHLKRVFSYCSVFPKDHEMVVEDVVLMWMAEGFLPESDEESMESKGHRYFADLVSRSLFEPSPRDEGLFVMHELVHELAKSVAGEVCCIIQTDRDHIKDRTRLLSIIGSPSIDVKHLMKYKVGDVGKQLRTLAFLGYVPDFTWVNATFQRFECVRVLRINSVLFVEIPSYIGDLKHLRLIDFSSTGIKELPKSMCKLHNLQSLILKRCSNLTKVLSMESFVELRHLDIKGSVQL